ncbi:MAG: agmatine deiminase family protein [Bacteroidales bacterium]
MLIQDNQTNILYLSELLKGESKGFEKYKQFYERFVPLLEENNIEVRFLKNTKDIWARDYMPIQIREDEFVQFDYQPPYALKYKKYQHTISDPHEVCAANGFSPKISTLKIDGGNVIKGSDFLILTDRALDHNPNRDVRSELAELFSIEATNVYFIPAEKDDEIGHADGMVRVVRDKHLLMNDYSVHQKDKEQHLKMNEWVAESPFTVSVVPYSPNRNKYITATGIYSNYLLVDDCLFLPQFDIDSDGAAIEIFSDLFPQNKIIPVLCNEIANEGGVLNCISWNIFAK